MKNYLIISSLFFAFTSLTFAQESKNDFSVDLSADLVSRYIWRGKNLSSSPSVQPSLGVNLGNFSIGTWASYSFSPELYQEVDLFLTYNLKYVSFTINDYFNPVDTLSAFGDYFHIEKASTRHTLEGMITLSGPESFPASLVAGVMFYGNDFDQKGDHQYSSYLELNYSTRIHEVELKPFIGITPWSGYYGNDFGVINLGITAIRNINISEKFQIPVKGSFIINPQLENVFFVIGITF
jgi:hypothetical protein